ncbi:MAG: hypothetical protein WD740_03205 [Anaerolineales bacterium]
MSEIALAVRHPGGKRHAQLLHDDLPVGEVILLLASRLELPTKLNYELIQLPADKALDAKKTLRACGVGAGAELLLKPIRDRAFDLFIDALKDELKGEVKGEARKQAKNLLGKLLAAEEVAKEAAASSQAAASGAADSVATPPAEASAPKDVTPKPKSCLRSGCLGLLVLTLLAAVAIAASYDTYVKPALNQWLPDLMAAIGGQGPEPQLGTGDVQVTLRWENPVDLDLHVIDPSGEEIYFSHPSSLSGGTLDVDANAGCDNDAPVENVFWPAGGAPFGGYQVYVKYFRDCGYTGANAYSVTILVDGQTFGPYEGVLTSVGEEHYVMSFSR